MDQHVTTPLTTLLDLLDVVDIASAPTVDELLDEALRIDAVTDGNAAVP